MIGRNWWPNNCQHFSVEVLTVGSLGRCEIWILRDMCSAGPEGCLSSLASALNTLSFGCPLVYQTLNNIIVNYASFFCWVWLLEILGRQTIRAALWIKEVSCSVAWLTSLNTAFSEIWRDKNDMQSSNILFQIRESLLQVAYVSIPNLSCSYEEWKFSGWLALWSWKLQWSVDVSRLNETSCVLLVFPWFIINKSKRQEFCFRLLEVCHL